MIKNVPNIFLLIFCTTFFLTTCNTPDSNDVKQVEKVKNVTKEEFFDYSTVKLTVERGAFHFDKFILMGNKVFFYPQKDKLTDEFKEYNSKSEEIISSIQKKEFIRHIIENGFLKLEERYVSNSSCNSPLIITLSIGNKEKKVFSEDYQRGCPELMKYIENKIIELHNHKLVRVSLPG